MISGAREKAMIAIVVSVVGIWVLILGFIFIYPTKGDPTSPEILFNKTWSKYASAKYYGNFKGKKIYSNQFSVIEPERDKNGNILESWAIREPEVVAINLARGYQIAEPNWVENVFEFESSWVVRLQILDDEGEVILTLVN